MFVPYFVCFYYFLASNFASYPRSFDDTLDYYKTTQICAKNHTIPENLCGVQVTHCDIKYRSYDGTCNNLKNPSWGSNNSTYARLLPARYADGISKPIDYKTKRYPSSRVLSLTLNPNREVADPLYTLLTMQYGQIIVHDMSLTSLIGNGGTCCTNGQIKSAPDFDVCYPIIYPKNDPMYEDGRLQCTEFVRTFTDINANCTITRGSANQMSLVSSYLDLHIIYGRNVDENKELRELSGGRLLLRNVGLGFPQTRKQYGQCDETVSQGLCYVAGDIRVSQHPQLSLLHVLLFREHNRIAGELRKLNPNLSDEEIFQEARRILIAIHQKIIYEDWLPIFLGKHIMQKYKIGLFETDGYIDDYEEHTNAQVLNSHANSAFRSFHSSIAGLLLLSTPDRNDQGFMNISKFYNYPTILEQNDNFDLLTVGLTKQHQEKIDKYYSLEISTRLLGNLDLRANDIHRSRDHGLPSYNSMRAFCGLQKARVFEDFLDVIPKERVEKIKQLYKHPDDVDLPVGADSEVHEPGTLAGKTNLCIMIIQFYKTRAGDRFFYENNNEPTKFTLPQLNEIRKATISRIFCDNSNVKQMQPDGFKVVSEKNPLNSCSNLPSIDLSKWKENN